MSFPALDPATGCRNAGPGATNMLYWLDRESGWAGTVYNLGVCNCRMIAGKTVRSTHGECRAWDAGLPMVNGRANPIGHEIIRALLPRVGQLGIQCLIFDRTIWSAASPQGKRYTGVSPHYDHIHGEHTRRSASVLNVPTVRSVMGSQSTQPPPFWAPPPPMWDPVGEEEISMFVVRSGKGIAFQGDAGQRKISATTMAKIQQARIAKGWKELPRVDCASNQEWTDLTGWE